MEENKDLFERAIDAAYQNSLKTGEGEQGYSQEDLLIALKTFADDSQFINPQLLEALKDFAWIAAIAKPNCGNKLRTLIQKAQEKHSALIKLKAPVKDLDENNFVEIVAPLSEEEVKEWGYLKEQTEEQREAGYWFPCSGCYEGGEYGGNNSNYHSSVIFKTQMGCGCGECGGIGVVFDNTDYEEFYNLKAGE